MSDIVFGNNDLLSEILSFRRRDEYLFVGTVNKAFRSLYHARQTKLSLCVETVSRLQDSGIQSLVMQCGSVDVMRHA